MTDPAKQLELARFWVNMHALQAAINIAAAIIVPMIEWDCRSMFIFLPSAIGFLLRIRYLRRLRRTKIPRLEGQIADIERAEWASKISGSVVAELLEIEKPN